jgi:hypothetical protein
VDVGEKGIEALRNQLEGINTQWARNITTTYSAEALQKALRFWAIDSEPAGTGYATTNIAVHPMPFLIKIDDLCTQMPSFYEQMGFELVDAECGLKINGLDAARFVVRLRVGPLATKEYQYYYVEGDDVWVVSLGVDEIAWSEYEQIFDTIAKSFRVD